jgi:hypothetical protein
MQAPTIKPDILTDHVRALASLARRARGEAQAILAERRCPAAVLAVLPSPALSRAHALLDGELGIPTDQALLDLVNDLADSLHPAQEKAAAGRCRCGVCRLLAGGPARQVVTAAVGDLAVAWHLGQRTTRPCRAGYDLGFGPARP